MADIATNGPYREEDSDSQPVVGVRPSSGDSSSPRNGTRALEQRLVEEDTSGQPGHTMFRPAPKSINDLPLDLIILVLETALDEVANLPHYQGGGYLGMLKTLAAVCRMWKSTIQDTPRLWKVIDSTITLNERHYMLRKSKKCALAFRHSMDRTPGLDTSDFLDFASFNMYRCSSASLEVEGCHQAARVLGSPAPILREATVIASNHDSHEHIILFDGQAGMLENLRLSNIPIQWDLGLPPKLRRIQISYGSNTPIAWAPSPPQVLSALSTCSGLEFFYLCGRITVHNRLEWEELGVRGPTAELPMLKELKIENMSKAEIAYILKHLSTPPLRNLKLMESIHSEVDGTLTPLLHPPSRILIESIRRALVHCDKVALMLDPERCSLEVKGAGGYVSLSRLKCADPDELTRWVMEELASELSSMPELHLGLEVLSMCPGPELRSLAKLMKVLKNVARLSCMQVSAEVNVVLKHLARPYQASDGWRWHWPGLKHLDLNGAFSYNDLALTMIRDRYGTPQEEDGGTGDGTPKWRPSPLTTLRLGQMKSLQPKIFQDIVDIVGKEVLKGDGWCVD
ncbi:hypothetical protein M407DRAFT_20142 [Tulasnella calospora MUT 4182]|uniref:F-box domain-containing protein n=1 Tax=Tulasnella calospora MUT 4182 TaxID=1051891 RepID=A0A0C3QGM9_9AGAM|nr:hypothetical protein M407DRAFT_20142 [Tulasnella calospora MUT 4182]